jgi:hypothetical protein
MYLFLDEKGCVTTRDKAVEVVYGLPDWVEEDIREYGTRYCCKLYRKGGETGRWGVLWIIRCEGMGGARIVYTEMFPCIDGDGKEFVINRDNISIAKLPLVCLRRDPHGNFEYKKLIDRYQYMLEVAKKARCSGYCVLDWYGSVVVFGSDLHSVIDNWVKLMKRKTISVVSVLV